MAEFKKKRFSDLPTFTSDIRELLKDPKTLPPVDQWKPERVGEIDIFINALGEWFYQGNKMERLSVVQLLASIMRKDEGEYYLVSPTEKLKIKVEDVPFMAVMMDIEGKGESQTLHFSTQVGDCFTLSLEHGLRVSYNEKGEPSPYLHVRSGLEAKVNRSVYYELANLIVALDDHVPSDNILWPATNHSLGNEGEKLKELRNASNQAMPTIGLWSAGNFFVF